MSFESYQAKPVHEAIAPEPVSLDEVLTDSNIDAQTRERLTTAITQLKEQHERELQTLTERIEHFEKTSSTDALTGAHNLRGMKNELARLHSEQSRENIPTNYSLIFFDLNNFKTINDTVGHQAGDDTLIEVVHALNETVRPTDTLVRNGGDEFTVILPGTDETRATLVAGRILDAILSDVNTRLGQKYENFPGVAASIGVASYRDVEKENPNLTDTELLKVADSLMYKAKEHKKIDPLAGKIVRYSEK